MRIIRRRKFKIMGIGKIGDNKMSTTEYCRLVDENVCPDCGAELIPQEGCRICYNCGFTNC